MKLCTKPFTGAIKPPRHEKWNPKDQYKAPEVETNLEYVFGYRAKDMRNNIRYLKNGTIIYVINIFLVLILFIYYFILIECSCFGNSL